MEEREYRSAVAEAFRRIERAFEKVDPDVAECENAHGALAITLAGRSKIVVSPQPSVRQIWLAVAFQGKGFHFGWDPSSGSWIDDRGEGRDLFRQISEAVAEATGVPVAV